MFEQEIIIAREVPNLAEYREGQNYTPFLQASQLPSRYVSSIRNIHVDEREITEATFGLLAEMNAQTAMNNIRRDEVHDDPDNLGALADLIRRGNDQLRAVVDSNVARRHAMLGFEAIYLNWNGSVLPNDSELIQWVLSTGTAGQARVQSFLENLVRINRPFY